MNLPKKVTIVVVGPRDGFPPEGRKPWILAKAPDWQIKIG